MRHLKVLSVLALAFLASCSDGARDLNLTSVVEHQYGSFTCPSGGSTVLNGVDSDRDGMLSPEEVTETNLQCNDSEALLEEFRHELIAGGNGRIVKHSIVSNTTGKPQLVNYPYGTQAVTPAHRSQVFSQAEVVAHYKLKGHDIAQNLHIPVTKNISGLNDESSTSTGNDCTDSAPDGYHCGIPIGYSSDTGNVPGLCHYFKVNTLGQTFLGLEGTSTTGATSDASSTNISASATGSYGAFSAKADFSYDNEFQSSSFGGSLLYNFYSMYQPQIIIDEAPPSKYNGTDWPYVSGLNLNKDVYCGNQYIANPLVGMVIDGALTYQASSSSEQSELSASMTASGSSGLSSGKATVGTAIASASSNSSASFEFTATTVGGGPKYMAIFLAAYDQSSYSGCFAPAAGASQSTISSSCGKYFNAFVSAATTTLSQLNADLSSASNAIPADLSFLQIFPNGYQPITSSATTIYSTMPVYPEPSSDTPKGTYFRNGSTSIRSDLLAQFELLNQSATLANRAKYLKSTVVQSNLLVAGSSNDELPSKILNTLDVLSDGFETSSTVLLNIIGDCLYGPAQDGADIDCTNLNTLKANGISSAWDWFGSGKSTVRDSLYSAYNFSPPSSTTANLLAQNSIALRLNANSHTCFLKAGAYGSYACDGLNFVDPVRQYPMAVIWVDELPSGSAVGTPLAYRPAAVLFQIQKSKNVYFQVDKDNTAQIAVFPDTSGAVGGMQFFNDLLTAQGAPRIYSFTGPLNSRLVPISGSTGSDYYEKSISVTSQQQASCPNQDYSTGSCGATVMYQWDTSTPDAKYVIPKIAKLAIQSGDGSEREIFPPDCTSFDNCKATKYAAISFEAAQNNNDDLKCLAIKYVALNRSGYGGSMSKSLGSVDSVTTQIGDCGNSLSATISQTTPAYIAGMGMKATNNQVSGITLAAQSATWDQLGISTSLVYNFGRSVKVLTAGGSGYEASFNLSGGNYTKDNSVLVLGVRSAILNNSFRSSSWLYGNVYMDINGSAYYNGYKIPVRQIAVSTNDNFFQKK